MLASESCTWLFVVRYSKIETKIVLPNYSFINFFVKFSIYVIVLMNIINAQIALPTFHAVHKPHTTTSSGTQTFTYTGSQQTFTVPSGVTSLVIDIKGPSGGENAVGSTVSQGNHIPGVGGRVQTVTAGTVIYLYVGGRGSDASSSSAGAGGWNGGGDGAVRSQYRGGGGGGASDLRINGTSLSNRMVIAGGGGGAAYNYGEGDDGGDGGGLTGANGQSNNNTSNGRGGEGGTQSQGGDGGQYGSSYSPGTDGTLGVGGDGGASTSGGGGGGGYYGGGGGSWSGGGGGSSYANSDNTSNTTHTQGYNDGNGEIIVTW
jgi:hypothetical protein